MTLEWERPYSSGVYIAKVGMKVDLVAEIAYKSWSWGSYIRYIFYDEAGNRIMWRTRKNLSFEQGTKVRIKGRVRHHRLSVWVRHHRLSVWGRYSETQVWYCKITKEL